MTTDLVFTSALMWGVFGDGERAVRGNFPFDTSVNEEVVGELYGTIDVDVVAENVALSA